MRMFVLVLVFLAGAGVFLFFQRSEFPALKNYSPEVIVKQLEEKISAPPPLRGPDITEPSALLTRNGVLQWTNVQRANNGLIALEVNAKLNAAAVFKLEDMFEKQYFAHVSPEGRGAGDLAKEAGYEFISVGENLALGNYKDDKTLVQAWMDSPGHRANILKGSYREIGIAVGKGAFEGNQVWLAVQIFGAPASLCPQPESALKTQIEEFETQLVEFENGLSNMREEIESMHQRRRDQYRAKVEEYNALVAQYNTLVENTKTIIQRYNAQVQLFNDCVATQI